MSSYTPEFYYGHIPGTYGEIGLVPWPEHMKPRQSEALPDIDIMALFSEAPRQEANLPVATIQGTIVLTLNAKDRVGLATTIDRLIDMLDALEGDCDLEATADDEPSLGWTAAGKGAYVSTHKLDLDLELDDADTEHSLGWGLGTQAHLHVGDEREDENEHGGDVCDVPHDDLDEGNAEPFMGWGERCGQWQVTQELERAEGEPSTWDDPNDTDLIDYPGFRALEFEGGGYRVGKDQLRDLGRRRPDRHQNYVRTSPGYGWMS